MISKTISDELFAAITYLWLSWERHFPCIQYSLVLKNRLLGLIVSERFCTKKQLVEYHTHAPDVHLVCYLRRVLLETLGSLIPVCTDALRSQLDFLVPLIYDLAQAKVSYLHLAIVEDDVLWLEVIMNNLLFAFVQILKPT